MNHGPNGAASGPGPRESPLRRKKELKNNTQPLSRILSSWNRGPIDMRLRLDKDRLGINAANVQENVPNVSKILLTQEHVCDIIVVEIGRLAIIYILSRYHTCLSYHILNAPA